MSDQVNKEQTKDVKQEKITELSDDKLDEVAGGVEFQELTLLNRDRPGFRLKIATQLPLELQGPYYAKERDPMLGLREGREQGLP